MKRPKALKDGHSQKDRQLPEGSCRVGLTGFEPATSSPPVKRATKLRYSPRKRTEWDSNPRYGQAVHGISNAAPSAARTPVLDETSSVAA